MKSTKLDISFLKKLAEDSFLNYSSKDLEKDLEYIKEFDKLIKKNLENFNLEKVEISNFPFLIESNFLDNKKINQKIDIKDISERTKDNYVVLKNEKK